MTRLTYFSPGGETRRVPPETSKTCLIVVIIVGVAILVAAAIALGVVFGGKSNSKPHLTEPLRDKTKYFSRGMRNPTFCICDKQGRRSALR